jgi:predicted metal-dependent peptidase
MSVIDRAQEIIGFGRGMARKKAPYIATTLHGLVPCPVPGLRERELGPIGVTPGLCLYFDPDWVVNDPELQNPTKAPDGQTMGQECVAGCIYHECWHILNGFHRLEALTKKGTLQGLSKQDAQDLANLAGDLSINSMIRTARWVLPSWVAYPEKYEFADGLMTEEYWELLLKKYTKVVDSILVVQLIGGGQGKTPALGPCAGRCGGGAGNQAQEELERKLDAEFGRHKADIERIKITTKEQIKQHLETKGRGSAPGYNVTDVTFKHEEPLVPWERVLFHIAKRTSGRLLAGDDDYSMARPDKRTAMLGVVLPGLIEQELEVVFIRDTSGSMNEEQLNYANNEIIHCMKATGVDRVWLIDADVIAHGTPRRVSIRDIPKAKIRGRGGTSFVDALEKVSKLRPKPTIAFYMTDGDGFAPAKPPMGVEVIWCIVPHSHYRRRPTPWGHFVVCSNDRSVRESYEQPDDDIDDE